VQFIKSSILSMPKMYGIGEKSSYIHGGYRISCILNSYIAYCQTYRIKAGNSRKVAIIITIAIVAAEGESKRDYQARN
jgi:hypothetical protein